MFPEDRDNISLDLGNNTSVRFQVVRLVDLVARLIGRVYPRWVGSNKMMDRSSIPFHCFRSAVGGKGFGLRDWGSLSRGVRMRRVEGNRRVREQRRERRLVVVEWVVGQGEKMVERVQRERPFQELPLRVFVRENVLVRKMSEDQGML